MSVSKMVTQVSVCVLVEVSHLHLSDHSFGGKNLTLCNHTVICSLMMMAVCVYYYHLMILPCPFRPEPIVAEKEVEKVDWEPEEAIVVRGEGRGGEGRGGEGRGGEGRGGEGRGGEGRGGEGRGEEGRIEQVTDMVYKILMQFPMFSSIIIFVNVTCLT